LSAHKAAVAFFKWLIANHPDKWEWWLKQEPSRTNTMTFKESVEMLEYIARDIPRTCHKEEQ